MIGTSTITAHAPCVNFVIPMTISTVPVAIAPRPLISRPSRQCGSLIRRCRLAIPACDNVNEVKTPIA